MLINDVISWNQLRLRILHLENNSAFLFPIDQSADSYRVVSQQDLNQALEAGTASKVPDPFSDLRHRKFSGKVQERAKANFELIKSIVSSDAVLFDKQRRSDAIRKASGNNGSAARRIRRLLGQWWRKGQMPNSLVPAYGTNAGRSFAGMPIGRKAAGGKHRLAVTPETREAFDRIVRKYVFNGKQSLSLYRAYSMYLAEFADKHPDQEMADAASFWQFRRFFYKNYTPAEKARGRSTRIAYEKDYRSLTGSVYDVVWAPGSIYEIDSTVDNVTLVSESDRTKIVGSPVLYLVTDVYTGMIAGFAVQLENAGFDLAADALYNAVMDKVEFCQRYGIEIRPEEWPIKGLPAKIVADNGELRSDQIETLSKTFCVEASLTPPYHPDKKPVVERAIGQVQAEVRCACMPGVHDPIKLKKAGGHDARLEAAMTLHEYTQVLIHVILTLNKRIRDCTPKNLPQNVKATPLELWAWAKSEGNMELRSLGKGDLRLALSRHYDCTFSKKGINVGGIRYLCDRADELGYFDRYPKNERPKNMQMVIESSDVSKAYLIPDPEKDPNTHWECRLAPASQPLEGKTLIEAKEYLKTASATREEARQEMAESRANLMKQLKEIKGKAKESKPQDPRSKAQKTADIGENRFQERIRQQASNPKLIPKPKPIPEPEATEAKTPEPAKNYPSTFEEIHD